jgi:ankyrin repeat protein
MMLLRKHDWHDLEGIEWLLDHGADPNQRVLGRTSLLHALLRDNEERAIELLLNHGGDPLVESKGVSGMALAARRGRRELLELFERRGFTVPSGFDGLLAACARGDEAAARKICEEQPDLLAQLKSEGGSILSCFAGNGNKEGAEVLLNLGLPADSVLKEVDGYFGIAEHSTALHVAAWRMRPEIVQLLLDRGATVDAKDARNRTPLMLAVRACVDSYWKERRTPDSVRILLEAGASTQGIEYPSGYSAVDSLLLSKRLEGSEITR